MIGVLARFCCAVVMGVPATLAAIELAPGVDFLPGTFVRGTQPDGNTVILRGADGLVVIDSGRHVAHTQRIVDFARSADVPVRFVINTHWHLDHVGGNPLLRSEFPGLRVVASAAIQEAMTGFLATYQTQLETMVAQAATAEEAQPFRDELRILDAGSALAPDEVVTASGRRTFSGREFDVHLETYAVTAGDLWLFDPKTRILIAGDLVTLPAPLLDTACPEGWQAALGRLAAVDFVTLAPGHGRPLDRADFAQYRAAFDDLLVCAASEVKAESCSDGWLAAIRELVPESDRSLSRILIVYYVDQILRGDPSKRAERCGEKQSTP